MTMPTIAYRVLEDAFDWVASDPDESEAYISKTTGKVFYWTSFDAGPEGELEELPDDHADENLYWAIPDKRDLDLGKDLVLAFSREYLPDHYDRVRDIFRQSGAYRNFKDLLEKLGFIETWYDYESAQTKAALLKWAKEKGMVVDP